jgi:ornithine cyclodeaminase/alanine dehydrogenase-like protein (mu-crystallin family)
VTSPNQSPSSPAPIRLISAEEVVAGLPMAACIEAVEAAFRALARGEAEQPLRTVIRLPDGESSFLAMPAALGSPRTLGAKLLTLFPRNHGRGVPSHQGVIVTFNPDDGSLSAVVDAGSVTAIRTAAASAVATRALARSDASELAILGSGVQARTHVEAMLAVRPIRRVRAWSPNRERLEAFVAEVRDRHGVPAEAASSARVAVEGADLVCTVTASPVPVLEGAWVAPGVHVNAVGASTPTTRELDARAVALSRFFVDRRESALAEAGDWILARDEGAVTDADLAGEVGEVLLGTVPGRTDAAEVTVFKSLGLAIQDLAAVACIVQRRRSTAQ